MKFMQGPGPHSHRGCLWPLQIQLHPEGHLESSFSVQPSSIISMLQFYYYQLYVMNYIFSYLIIYVYKPKFYLCIINYQYKPIYFSYHYIKFKTLDSALTFRYQWVFQQYVLSIALHHASSVLLPRCEIQCLLGPMAGYVTGDFLSCHKYWPHTALRLFYLYFIFKFRRSIMWVKYHI